MMTRRERLTAIFRGEAPDRPAVKLWGAGFQRVAVLPAYEPVRDAAIELTDLMESSAAAFNLHYGAKAEAITHTETRETDSPDWVEDVFTVQTPHGPLSSVSTRSTRKLPGYQKEHLLKEPDDIHKLLSIDYEPLVREIEAHEELDRKIGDAGIVMFGLDHAMYGLERLIGSENFALWSLDCEDLLLEAMGEFARRIRQHAEWALAAGVKGVFGWVGPELCIPPLMSPAAFDTYVTALDKPLIDLIHNGGGCVWVHCHGKMSPVIEKFVDMGVDVLNPIEPPPMGDLTLAEAFALVGDRMGLEGNIETHDLMMAPTELLREKIHTSLDAGAGRRHILCPSSGYMEAPEPSEQLIRNLLLYVNESVRYAEAQA
jgi:uroporphyrinogen decarboxylase-like protein